MNSEYWSNPMKANRTIVLTLVAACTAVFATAACGKTKNSLCSPSNAWGAPGFSCGEPETPEPKPEPKPVVEDTPKEEPKPEPKVVVRKGKIEILEKVQFATGSADLADESTSLLDEVAATLKKTPEIKKVRVEGHTDNTGGAAMNKGLSQRRAESVRAYLIKQGVDAGRLTAKGYGQSKPIAGNDTDEGKEKNRRVEFTILSRDE